MRSFEASIILQLPINNSFQGQLNPLGVNCLRYFAARAISSGADAPRPRIPIEIHQRAGFFIFVEKSIERGTQWVVFEPNDTPCSACQRSVSDFLTGLWKDGMLQGQTKEQAYFVRCDRSTMTQADIDNGRLIMVIGTRPCRPSSSSSGSASGPAA